MSSNAQFIRAILRLLLLWHMSVSAAMAQGLPQGNIDNALYDVARAELIIVGWSWSNNTKQSASNMTVTTSGKTHKIENFTRIDRNDVKAALALDTAEVGFVIRLDLSDTPMEELEIIKLSTIFSIDEKLILFKEVTKNHIEYNKRYKRHYILLGLIVIVIFFSRFPIFRHYGKTTSAWMQKHPRHVTAWIWGLFFILVASGITGSSLEALFNGSTDTFGNSVVETKGQNTILFKSRSVRSDEWGILTPSALAQSSHIPPFPIINKNIGLNGQNMGIIGMTGVPIAQPAALARPATWGYFFLPLRQALSWHWQFPFFACLFILWRTLNILRPTNSAFNFVLSGLFCIAPYAAAWSLWPLYAAFFPLGLFVAVAALLRTDRNLKAGFLGIAIGILFSGWLFVLYPPWQISIGTFCLGLGVAWLISEWKEIQFSDAQWLGLIAALATTTLLIGSWWLETHSAIAAIQQTVYPGARNALSGGDMHALWALRGYTNPEALPYGTGKLTNSSEIGSYILFPIAVLFIGITQCWRRSQGNEPLCASIIFVAFCLSFWFFGIPNLLAHLTAWSLVPSGRVDPALGLAFTVILSLIYQPREKIFFISRPRLFVWMAFGISLLSSGLTFFTLRLIPDSFSATNDLVFSSAMALAVFSGSWWIMRDRTLPAVAMLLLLNGVSTIGFNPLARAPSALKPSEMTAALASEMASPSHLERTLVIGGGGLASMAMAAAGIPTVNGVFYYPQPDLWKKIGLPKSDWPLVNRYQHLGFQLGEVPHNATFKVESPRPDMVNVTVNPVTFNFSETGARRVAALARDATALRASPYLQELGEHKGIFWFKVREF